MLLQTIDCNFAYTYNFFYLPIDFKNQCNVGYAFINFIDFKVIPNFFATFDGKRWERFNSDKICAISYARIQGINALIKHFENSSVMQLSDQTVKPILFV